MFFLVPNSFELTNLIETMITDSENVNLHIYDLLMVISSFYVPVYVSLFGCSVLINLTLSYPNIFFAQGPIALWRALALPQPVSSN